MLQDTLIERIMSLVPLVLSLTVHEWAHAYSAFLLGDDTASRQGRLTLNPLVHMDPIGTFIAPLMGIPFGWAKPVEYDPLRFRRGVSMRAGIMIVKAAGPLANLVITLVCAVLYGLLLRSGRLHDGGAGVSALLRTAIVMNIALCIFNFLPIPPLDGGGVVDGLIPYRFRPAWEQYTQRSAFLLIGLVAANAYVFHGTLFNAPIAFFFQPVERLIMAVAGRG
jgi:Zn-dependent protease